MTGDAVIRRAHGLLAALAALAACVAAPAHAQLNVPAKGDGSVSFTWQTVTDHYHLDYQGNLVDAGKITAHSAQLRIDYGLTDRLAVSVTAPYVIKKYEGTFAHDPDPFDPHAAHAPRPPRVAPAHDGEEHEDIAILDDGDYHGTWQDLGVGLRWKWKERPWMLTPFVNYSWPSHDYTFFAHAAPGTRQKRLQLGIAAGRQLGPRWPNTYVQASYSYTFVEKVQDISVNYSNLNLEVGRFITPQWSVRGFVMLRKTHGGLDFPVDFPSRTNERWLHHDRIQRVDYVNYGFGATYRASDKWTISGNWLTTGWGENGHAIHNAVTVGVARSF